MWRNWLTRAVFVSACSGAALAQSRDEDRIAHFESLIKAGQFETVAAEEASYVQSHPASWKASYQLGYAYFMLHQNWRSLQMVSKSLAVNDRFAEAHKILALDLNILGHQDLALTELDKAVALDPTSAESNYELGRLEYERGSYLKAVQHLQIARALDPSSVRVYHNLGLAYAAIGKTEEAVASFDEGLRLNDQQGKPSAWPLIDYGTFLNMRNEFAQAHDILVRAVAMDARWDQAYFELSKADRGLNLTDDAVTALKRAISLNPNKPEYHYVLARLYTQTHHTELANAELAAYENHRTKDAPK